MQIILFLFFIFAIIGLFAIKKEELPLKTKIALLVTLFVLLAAAGVYELSKSANTSQNRETLNAFLQGKTLDCGGVSVHTQAFDYISGTQVFMPKRSNTQHKGLVLEITTCKIRP
ncbi:MAG: hypothetical protein IBX44_05530 [Sulfurospirillum sp.]|nr:hypothetical protein [Sulfurospirillum sp.]